eukprot:1827815-Rhodomonas_salina.2
MDETPTSYIVGCRCRARTPGWPTTKLRTFPHKPEEDKKGEVFVLRAATACDSCGTRTKSTRIIKRIRGGETGERGRKVGAMKRTWVERTAKTGRGEGRGGGKGGLRRMRTRTRTRTREQEVERDDGTVQQKHLVLTCARTTLYPSVKQECCRQIRSYSPFARTRVPGYPTAHIRRG